MEKSTLSKATLGRLPEYLEYLKSLPADESPCISATAIAKSLGLGDVQVRKDLSAVSGAGKPKIGYNRQELIKSLEDALGRNKITDAVLVGAGQLGRALLNFDAFTNFGVRIKAAFDRNEQLFQIGSGKKSILPIRTFSQYCKENSIKIGIITVGAGSAQEVCDTMVQNGIKAIWNFAPCHLNVPPDVIVQQENLALSLAHLNSLIS